MKNISSKNKNMFNKKTLLGVGIILILIIGAGVYFYINADNSSESDLKKTSESSGSTGKSSSGKGAEQPDTLPDNSQDLTTDDVPINSSAVAQIIKLEEKDSVVHFSAKISGVNTIGRCVVTFSTPNDRPITKEFDAVKSSAEHVCAIDVSSLEFSYLGKWNVNLRYYSEDKQVTTTGEITIS